MTEPFTLPLWAIVLLAFLAAAGFYYLIAIRLWRWFWDQRSQRIIERVNPHLQLKVSPFSLTRRRVLADRLASDPLVQETVAAVAAARGTPVAVVQKEANKLAFGMVPAFNPFFYFRVGHWLARRALRSLYNIRIGFADRDGLEQVSGDASVVFFVSHRSNIDYVLVTYLTAERTMLSFGVGEWSHIWPIQPLMRAAGGYFLHRDTDNPLYRRLLERYVQLATEARVPHAMFPEGALSPDGRLQDPKLGLLSYLTRTFDPATSSDIVFIPIGTNYDRFPEDSDMVSRNPGEFRNKGRGFVYRSGASISGRVLWETLRGRRFYGSACAQFGTPVSFHKWLREHWIDWATLGKEARYRLLSDLADELMGDISRLIPVTPVAVLCSVILKFDANPIHVNELRDAFEVTTSQIARSGAYIVFSGDQTRAAFYRAVDILCRRHAVRRVGTDRIELIPSAGNLMQYYANTIEQFVVDESGGPARSYPKIAEP
jgi:glycerol-3-phosphate O-acyltransferase